MGNLTVDEFRQKIDESQATCKICGLRAHSIVRHLATTHNQSVGQYKKTYPTAAVVSKIVSEFNRQLKRTVKASDDLDPLLEAFVESNTATLFTGLKVHFWAVPKENQFLIPKVDSNFYFEEKSAKSIAFGLLGGKNIYVEGPTGCGKTDGVSQIHAQLGLPVKRVNMNGDVTASNFIGSKHADVTKGTYFRYGSLPLAMKGGYTLLVDEIDYMPPSIAAVLNPVLEGKRELYLPDTDEHITAEKGFNIIGTANTGGKGDTTGVYTGTEIMNTAFLDRFGIKLTMDYLPVKEELAMLSRRFPNSNTLFVTRLVAAAKAVREQFKIGTIPITISTRKIIDILEAEPVLGQKEAIACSVLNWLDEDNVQVVTKILENSGVKL